jgi:hypothetical protein
MTRPFCTLDWRGVEYRDCVARVIFTEGVTFGGHHVNGEGRLGTFPEDTKSAGMLDSTDRR